MTSASGASPKGHAASQCISSDTSPRNPANPLDTPGFTGTDPLAGANLFVESPWQYGGDAADAIANLVGLGWMSREEGGTPMPWSPFEAKVNSMHMSKKIAFKVQMLEKIGEYPQAHQFSVYTAGGSGPAIFTQVQNYLCRMQRTTPGAAAEITTYFIKHGSGCTPGNNPNFDAEVNAVKDAMGTGGLHFVVDTRGDGNGPLKNRNPVKYGNEQLCNPPSRGLGPKPGASDGSSYGMYSPYLDGFVWVTTPGESANSTCPSRKQHYAASGIFDPNIAIGYASLANDRIGPSPRFPSRPW